MSRLIDAANKPDSAAKYQLARSLLDDLVAKPGPVATPDHSTPVSEKPVVNMEPSASHILCSSSDNEALAVPDDSPELCRDAGVTLLAPHMFETDVQLNKPPTALNDTSKLRRRPLPGRMDSLAVPKTPGIKEMLSPATFLRRAINSPSIVTAKERLRDIRKHYSRKWESKRRVGGGSRSMEFEEHHQHTFATEPLDRGSSWQDRMVATVIFLAIMALLVRWIL